MKEQWIGAKEFASITGCSVSAVYSRISLTQNTDPYYNKKYKKDGGRRLVNLAYFRRREQAADEMQGRFESAYFALLEKYGNEHALARAVADDLGMTANAVNMYFKTCFVVTRLGAVKKRLKYIEAMEKILEEK
ncbi:MAG TPA: hypothetical protein CFH81_08740 [Sulfurovum sp. UBA12169]|nr:MAG TPA: hypothetical protein CFH81_08740 [Sulfurovum sp. UBA12169]